MSTTQHETDMKVVDFLIAQHAAIRDLFAEVMAATGEERRDAFQRLVRLLAVHETAEEEIVHPLARRSLPGGAGIVDDRLAEERAAKELLAGLEEAGTEAPDFLQRLDQLRISVLTHARAEERYEFVRLGDQFGPAAQRSLVAAVQAAEATAPTHPHPGTESAAKNMMVGPFAAMTDRIRDIMRADRQV